MAGAAAARVGPEQRLRLPPLAVPDPAARLLARRAPHPRPAPPGRAPPTRRPPARRRRARRRARVRSTGAPVGRVAFSTPRRRRPQRGRYLGRRGRRLARRSRTPRAFPFRPRTRREMPRPRVETRPRDGDVAFRRRARIQGGVGIHPSARAHPRSHRAVPPRGPRWFRRRIGRRATRRFGGGRFASRRRGDGARVDADGLGPRAP